MRFQYKHFVIDAMPDFFEGEFRAHARIAPGELTGAPQPVIVDEADIGRFSREALAVGQAVDWATKWIDARGVEPCA